MKMRREALIAVLSCAIILGAVFLGTALGSDTSAATAVPEFRSGVSTTLGVAVDFDVLSSRANAIYDVIESDDTHIIWKFTGTTGDWAFVYADGRLVVASMVDFDLSAKDTLEKEMNDVIDMLNAVGGKISTAKRTHAINHASYYAGEAGVYHRIKYKFDTNLNLHLTVPQCTVKKARLDVEGHDKCNYCALGGSIPGQHYYINGKEVSGCDLKGSCVRKGISCGSYYCRYCGDAWVYVKPVNIQKNIPYGVHTITATGIDDEHTMFIEAYTSPATKNMVLYNDDYSIWIPETTKSLTLDKLMSIIGPCYPQKINIEAMQPEGNFNVAKATAVPISVNVTDSCGNAIDSASVQVAFENGDTTLLLAHVNDGIYNGTWVPWNVGHCNVTLTAIPPSWQTLEPESLIINGTVSML
jgi:hypothetical protein